MNSITIYDNGGQTFDRYTVVNTNTGEVYGMSHNPLSPQGFNQFSGKIGQDFNHPQHNDAIREKVTFDSLPADVQKAIENRVAA